MDSSDSWLPRLFRGVTMRVIPFLCNIGSQNVIVFPEPITEIDTMLFLASNLNATLHCQMQAWCRWDNNPPHESFVESSSRARMSYHNHPKSHLYSIM